MCIRDSLIPACLFAKTKTYGLESQQTTRFYWLKSHKKKYGGHEDQLLQKLCGMDRFRINALQKIIDTGQLSNENQQSAVNMLLIKVKIYLKGVTKRGKQMKQLITSSLLSATSW